MIKLMMIGSRQIDGGDFFCFVDGGGTVEEEDSLCQIEQVYNRVFRFQF